MRLSDPAHGIVTKTVHKTLPWGGGGRGQGGRDGMGQGVGVVGEGMVWVRGVVRGMSVSVVRIIISNYSI